MQRSFNYYRVLKVYLLLALFATGIGLTDKKAVSRIKNGKNVWAKDKDYALAACIAASPIKAAEWGQHGKLKDGYYPHYHAVTKYIGKNRYKHTGAHCWYL